MLFRDAKAFRLLSLSSGTGHRGTLLEAGEEAESEISRYALILDIFLLTCSKQQHGAPWSLLGGLLLSHTPSVAHPGTKLCLLLQDEGTDGLGRAGLDSQGPDAPPGSGQTQVSYTREGRLGVVRGQSQLPSPFFCSSKVPLSARRCPCLHLGTAPSKSIFLHGLLNT